MKNLDFEKLNQNVFAFYDSEIVLYNLKILNQYFGDNRYFHDPLTISPDKRFITIVEYKYSKIGISSSCRLVVFDVLEQNQWVSPWLGLGKFIVKELKTFASPIGVAKLAPMNLVRSLLNIKCQLSFEVKRDFREDQYHEVLFLPMSHEQCEPWESLKVPDRLDLKWSKNEIRFDGIKFTLASEPGPMLESEYWSDVTQVYLERRIEGHINDLTIKILGQHSLSIPVPCRNLTRFIDELERRFEIQPKKFIEALSQQYGFTELLWTFIKESNSKVIINERRAFKESDFESGIYLVDGNKIDWLCTYTKLTQSSLIQKGTESGQTTFRTKSAVKLGPWTLPSLVVFESSVRKREGPATEFKCDFQFFESSLETDDVQSVLKDFFNIDTILHSSDGSVFNYNDNYVMISLFYRGGIWSISISLCDAFYWSLLRQIDPHFLMMKNIRHKIVDNRISDCSYKPENNFNISKFHNADFVPSPTELRRFGLAIWTDEANQIQGISCYEASYFWPVNEFSYVKTSKEGYLGDRGESYDFTILTVYFKNIGQLQVSSDLEFNMTEAEFNEWFR